MPRKGEKLSEAHKAKLHAGHKKYRTACRTCLGKKVTRKPRPRNEVMEMMNPSPNFNPDLVRQASEQEPRPRNEVMEMMNPSSRFNPDIEHAEAPIRSIPSTRIAQAASIGRTTRAQAHPALQRATVSRRASTSRTIAPSLGLRRESYKAQAYGTHVLPSGRTITIKKPEGSTIRTRVPFHKGMVKKKKKKQKMKIKLHKPEKKRVRARADQQWRSGVLVTVKPDEVLPRDRWVKGPDGKWGPATKPSPSLPPEEEWEDLTGDGEETKTMEPDSPPMSHAEKVAVLIGAGVRGLEHLAPPVIESPRRPAPSPPPQRRLTRPDNKNKWIDRLGQEMKIRMEALAHKMRSTGRDSDGEHLPSHWDEVQPGGRSKDEVILEHLNHRALNIYTNAFQHMYETFGFIDGKNFSRDEPPRAIWWQREEWPQMAAEVERESRHIRYDPALSPGPFVSRRTWLNY